MPAMHLNELIQLNCFEIESTTIVNQTNQALNQLGSKEYDIVFLDIEMPGMNGFQLLEKVNLRANCSLVIVTAFENYALNSFKHDALAYLLKPVDENELIKSVRKAHQFHLKGASSSSTSDKKLKIYDKDEYHLVPIENVIRLEADGNYTKIVIRDNETLLSTQRIGHYEAELAQHKFFRIHRSHLINLSALLKVGKKSEGYLELNNGTVLPLSTNKRRILLKMI